MRRIWGKYKAWIHSNLTETTPWSKSCVGYEVLLKDLYHMSRKYRIWYRYEVCPVWFLRNLYHISKKYRIWYRYEVCSAWFLRNLYHISRNYHIWYRYEVCLVRFLINLYHMSKNYHIWYRYEVCLVRFRINKELCLEKILPMRRCKKSNRHSSFEYLQ